MASERVRRCSKRTGVGELLLLRSSRTGRAVPLQNFLLLNCLFSVSNPLSRIPLASHVQHELFDGKGKQDSCTVEMNVVWEVSPVQLLTFLSIP